MTDQVDRIRRRLQAEGESATEFFESLPDSQWDHPVYADGPAWMVRDILAHFVSAERTFVYYMRQTLAGGPGISRDFDIDAFNAREVAALGALEIGELRRAFRQVRLDTLALLDQISQDDLDRPGWHPWFWETRMGEMLQLIYRHTMLHLRDVRRALRAGGPVEAPAGEH